MHGYYNYVASVHVFCSSAVDAELLRHETDLYYACTVYVTCYCAYARYENRVTVIFRK